MFNVQIELGKRDKKPLAYWTIAFFVLAIVICLLLGRFNHGQKYDALVWVSILGSFSSIYGLALMFAQFRSVRETTEATQKKVDNISLVSEWSGAAELVRSAENDIERDEFAVAVYKLKQIKDVLIRLVSKDDQNDEMKLCHKYEKKLNEFISQLSDVILSKDPSSLNKTNMLSDLELISDFLRKRINKKINTV